MKALCLVVTAISMLPTAERVTAQERAVLGQGNVSCQAWTAARKIEKDESGARIAWVLGYITAFNHYAAKPQSDVSEGRSTEQITTAIDGYCSQHPTENVYRASVALIEELRRTSGR